MSGPRAGTASRFADCPAWLARALLAAVAALIAFGATLNHFAPSPERLASVAAGDSDLALYRAIADRVAGGEGYHAAAAAEHRARDFPLRPFLTVRPPALAHLVALTGIGGAALLLKLLVAATLATLLLRIRASVPERGARLGAGACAVLALLPLALDIFVLWHDLWSALLVALSLACRSRRRWGASLALGVAALAFREFAVAYLCVMAVAACYEGARREALAWLGGLALGALYLALHAAAVNGLATPNDLSSPGWAGAEGWRFILSISRDCGALALLPPVATALLVPLALLGWAGWRDPFGARGATLLGGTILGFSLIGRSDNVYWGFAVTPLFLVGLAFVPRALADLWRSARPRPIERPATPRP